MKEYFFKDVIYAQKNIIKKKYRDKSIIFSRYEFFSEI